MKTILYFDTLRNRKALITTIAVSVTVLAIVFFVFTIVDKCLPEWNAAYMKWPDVIRDLIGLSNWNSHLAVNIWQILSLIYPFYLVYVLMSGLCSSVIQEERLETIVYLRNIDVTYTTFLIAKVIFWVAAAFLSTAGLFVVNSIFLILIGAARNITFVAGYYLELFVISIFYLSIALFLASYKQHENVCKDVVSMLLLLPLLISRVPAIFRLFSFVMKMTGREGKTADILQMLGERLHPVEMAAPVTWCWLSIDVTWIYAACAVLICLIMGTSAFLIYLKKHEKGDNIL